MKVREFENLKKEIETKIATKKGELSLDDFEFIVNKRYRSLGMDIIWYDAVLFIQKRGNYNYIAIYCQSICGRIIQDTAVIQSFYVKNNQDLVNMQMELAGDTGIFYAEVEMVLRNL